MPMARQMSRQYGDGNVNYSVIAIVDDDGAGDVVGDERQEWWL